MHRKTGEGRKITLRLYCGKSIKTGQRLKKTQKEQPDCSPDGKPLKAGDYSIEELQRHIRASLRRPHQDPQSRDTKQSWFWCPNKDCRHPPTHADANAAVNIGRKFLAERINLAKVSKR